MDHPDIVSLICNYLNDYDKFSYLSITKFHTTFKEKMWFNERIHLYRIYGNKYFNRFTNVIICTKIKKCVDENGKLIACRRIKFPSGIKKIELLNKISLPILPEGLTHFHSNLYYMPDLPQSITHLDLESIWEREFIKTFSDDSKQFNNLKILNIHCIYDETQNKPIELPKGLTHLSCPSRKNYFKTPLKIDKLQYLSTYDSPNPSWRIPSMRVYDDYYGLQIGLKKLHLYYYNPTKISDSLSYLINLDVLRIHSLQGTINNDYMPPNITHFVLEDASRSNIKILPQSITNLSVTNLSKHDTLLLPNLTHFKIKCDMIGYDINHARIETTEKNFENVISPNLFFLNIDDAVIPPNIPLSVRHLKMGKYFNSPIKSLIPNFITHLSFSNNFNKSIRHNIPLSITHLSFGNGFFQKNLGRDLPQTITHLELSPRCYTLNKDALRNRGLSITIKHVYGKDPFCMDKY